MNEQVPKASPTSRLAETRTFRGGGLKRWQQGKLFIVGAGNTGQRAAMDALLAGASVVVCDFDIFAAENRETQIGMAGVRKIDSLIERANLIAPGRATGLNSDVRHVGIGEISKTQVMIDCSDDPTLAMPLTRISNGLRIPLLRAAIDGSGELEMGRVSCSHGGEGHSCQVCSLRATDLMANTPRTPCPAAAPQHAPTRAGGVIGSMIAGAAVLQAQRLVCGNDTELVLGRELLLDMSNMQMILLKRLRSADCLSGHVQWDLNRLWMTARNTTLPDLFCEAEQMLGRNSLTLEPFAHPFCTFATCGCGQHKPAVGTRWAQGPQCANCGSPMAWAGETARDRISRADVRELGIGGRTLSELGMPERGAMFVARATGQPPLRIVLD